MFKVTKLVAVAALAFSVAGCMQPPSRGVQSAAAGAAVGALAGAAIGGSNSNIAAGAVIGGITGAAVAAE